MIEILKKWLSRKVIITILTAVCDVLIARGSMQVETKELLLKLISALGVIYVTAEGIADIVSRLREKKQCLT